MNFDGEKEEKSEVKPSKVLHFRNIPPDTTEAELSRLASPFGTVTSVLILKGKNQAFLQLEDVRSAQAIVQYYSGFQPSLRGKVIYIQFSKREEITLTEDTHKEQQSAILLVTILNVQYAITLDVLHRVFSKYGQILKIIIFTKNGSFQSFVQFAEVASAVAAKRELENQNIYSQCCTLKIQYSQLSSLNVKVNSDKCRDYSLPSDTQLPFSDPVPWNWSPSPSHPAFPQPNYSPSNGNNANSKNNNNTNNNNNNNNNSNHNNNNNNNNSAHSSCVLIASGINPQTTTDELFTLFGVYGDVVRVKILYNKKDTALLQFATPQQASIAIENLNSLPFRGQRLKVSYSKHQSISLPKPSDNEDEDGMEYTKDYSNSPLHRYKIVGSKNFQHITAPSSVLHLSNIPLSATEELLYDLFSKFGSVNTVKFFTKDKRMALVEYSSVEEAVGALVSMHNYSIGDQNIRVSFSKTSINSR